MLKPADVSGIRLNSEEFMQCVVVVSLVVVVALALSAVAVGLVVALGVVRS